MSDGKDEVGTSDIGKDSEIDDVLGLDVNLTDVTESVTVTIAADHTTLETGQAVTLTATINGYRPGAGIGPLTSGMKMRQSKGVPA